MKVGLYLRVSTVDQAKEGYSIGEQEARLRDYSKAMQWEIHKVYVDPGYSGGNINRPGLQELIKDVDAGILDKVVVYKLDRLSRSQYDTLFLIQKVFLPNDCDFVSMTENFSTGSPLGRAMIGFLAVFAQLEKDRINERTIMGKEARAKEGKWGGGSSEPIGYDYDVATGELLVNEYEKMQILEAIDLFLGGMPLRTIATLFESKGYTYQGRSGKTSLWEPKRFKYVFASKLYLGYIKYGGQWYKGTHEPIIDEATHDKLVALLEKRKEEYVKHRKRHNGQTSYLGGLIYCKQCGGRYAKQSGKRWKDNEPPLYYCCYSRCKSVKKMIKDPNCRNKNWRMPELNEIVFNEIRKLALNPESITKLQNNKKEQQEEPNKRNILANEIKKIDNQISRFMDLYGEGAFTIEQISEKVKPLNEQREELKNELEKINADIGIITTEEAIEYISEFEDALEEGDFNQIRNIIESLIFRIDLDNDDVYIHWKFV